MPRMTEEQWDNRRHSLIVQAIDAASEVLMERNRSSTEALYWKNTNNVRRNLLMAAVKRVIYDEWIPDQETYQNVSELRSLALRRLTATVANHIDSNASPPPSPPNYDF